MSALARLSREGSIPTVRRDEGIEASLILQSHLGKRLDAFVASDRRLLQAARAEPLEAVG